MRISIVCDYGLLEFVLDFQKIMQQFFFFFFFFRLGNGQRFCGTVASSVKELIDAATGGGRAWPPSSQPYIVLSILPSI